MMMNGWVEGERWH